MEREHCRDMLQGRVHSLKVSIYLCSGLYGPNENNVMYVITNNVFSFQITFF